jgi:DNA-binding IclR family transcriptional regulator
VAALAVSGPAYRFDDKKLQESRTAIMEAAQIINRQLR